MSLARYPEAVNRRIDTMTGFWLYEQGIVTYIQDKVGLSTYYDKGIINLDRIHTKPLW